MTTILFPGKITLEVLETIFSNQKEVSIDRSYKSNVEASAEIVKQAVSAGKPVYGINTGFGKLSNQKINVEQTEELQRNLVLSHCSGVGKPLSENITYLMMVLKMISLSLGASGVRWSIIKHLEKMLNSGIRPVIPHQGSVGASGDLAPLAHMAAVMIGEGWAFYKGKKLTGSEALSQAGIQPIVLGPKEGLALINGTQFSTACALSGLFESWNLLLNSIVISSISTDAIMGSTDPLLNKEFK